MNKMLSGILLLFLCGSCSFIDYHPYDGRIEGETGVNQSHIEKIEAKLADADTICFAVISDTQRWYDETSAAVRSINAQKRVDFVMHCGDISDFGVTKEFDWQQDILNGLQMPYVVLLGNHDCLGTGAEVYEAMFGEENFAFTAGPVRFLCLNTNALEYDYSNPVPNLSFIENEADKVPDGVGCTVVAMHAKPYDEQFNNNAAKPFQYYLHKLKNPLFCVCGHEHDTQTFDLFDDGLLYYEIDCAKGREYYLFTVYKEGYQYEVVHY